MFLTMKSKKHNRIILIMRKNGQIKEILDSIDNLDLSEEKKKYKVNNYVKEFYIKDLTKISILFLFSKEKYLKHFLKSVGKESINMHTLQYQLCECATFLQVLKKQVLVVFL